MLAMNSKICSNRAW